MGKHYYILILLFVLTLNLSAETRDTELFAIHPKIGLSYNIYQSMFTHFENSPDCGLFQNGKGLGFALSLFAEKPVLRNSFLGLGLRYVDRGGKFAIETTLPIRDVNAYETSQLKSENQIKINLSYFEIQPEFKYSLSNIKIPLNFALGFRLAIPLVHSYNQSEVILSPENVKFKSNNKSEREISAGDINSINSMLYGLSAGLEYLSNLNSSTELSQRLSFDFNLNQPSSAINWSMYNLRYEIGLRFSIRNTQKLLKFPAKNDTLKKIPATYEKPYISLKFAKAPYLKLETGNELLATLPIVSAVFFETNSSKIPNYYIQQLQKLPSMFNGDPVEKRKYLLLRILNIVKNNSKALIVLNGVTSGPTNEPLGLPLAFERANNVKSALVNLGVPDSIIKVKADIFPKYPTNQEYKEGIIENQRVDINIKNAPIQKYVGIQNYAEVKGSTELKVDFKNLQSTNKLLLKPNYYDTTVVVEKQGLFTILVKMRLKDKEFHLKALLTNNNLSSEIDTLINQDSLPKQQGKLVLSNFEAVLLFQYGSSVLTRENQELLKQLISKLPTNSEIIINGSADALGPERMNKQLAIQRAKSAEDFIKSISNNKFKIKTTKNFKKFPEDTPEGRFFNRSIRIRVNK